MKQINLPSKQILGKRIRKWRKSEEYKLVPLAEKIGVSQGSISDIENGKAYPSYSTIFKLVSVFPDAPWEKILFKI